MLKLIFRKIKSGIYKIKSPILVYLYRRQGVKFGKGAVFYGAPMIERCRGSAIEIGERVVLCSDSQYTALALNHKVKIKTLNENAAIKIGDDVGISGACIVGSKEIIIGSEVLMGANVLVVDSDFHPISPANRRFSDEGIAAASVNVGNNVFIGGGVIILKGVLIGDDSVVAAGAVVVAGKYPNGSIIAGNPARIVGSVYKR